MKLESFELIKRSYKSMFDYIEVFNENNILIAKISVNYKDLINLRRLEINIISKDDVVIRIGEK